MTADVYGVLVRRPGRIVCARVVRPVHVQKEDRLMAQVIKVDGSKQDVQPKNGRIVGDVLVCADSEVE